MPCPYSLNTDHAPSPAPLPRGSIVGLALAAFGSGMVLRVTDPMLPRLAADFSLTIGQASWAVTLYSIAYGLAQLLFGPLGERYGKYRVIALGCMACAITTLACALAPGFVPLLSARLVGGIVAAPLIPLSMAWLGDVIHYEQRQPVLARFLIGQIAGLSTGVMVGGVAAEHLGWRTPFYGIALVFLLTGLALLRMNRLLPPFARSTQRPASGPALGGVVADFRYVLRQPWARVVLLSVMVEGGFLYGAFAYIVTHLHRMYGMALSQAGLVVMLFGAGGLLFAAFVRRLVRSLGEAGLARRGGMLAAACYVVLALSPWWWTALPACLGIGLGFYMFHNTLQTNATQMAPERRGAALAAFAACFFTGQSLGVALFGALLPAIGTSGVMALGGLGLLAVALNFARWRMRHAH